MPSRKAKSRRTAPFRTKPPSGLALYFGNVTPENSRWSQAFRRSFSPKSNGFVPLPIPTLNCPASAERIQSAALLQLHCPWLLIANFLAGDFARQIPSGIT